MTPLLLSSPQRPAASTPPPLPRPLTTLLLQVYIDTLASLREVGDKVVRRYTEHEGRQGALNLLGSSVVHVRKVLEAIKEKVRTHSLIL